MNVVDTALAQAKQVIGKKVTEKVTDAATAESHIQAITIGKPRREVIDLFRDPVGLSQVFGDIADVHEAGVDRLRWAFFSVTVLRGTASSPWRTSRGCATSTSTPPRRTSASPCCSATHPPRTAAPR